MKYTDAEREILCTQWPTTSAEDLRSLLRNRSCNAINAAARDLGLKKQLSQSESERLRLMALRLEIKNKAAAAYRGSRAGCAIRVELKDRAVVVSHQTRPEALPPIRTNCTVGIYRPFTKPEVIARDALEFAGAAQ